MRKFTDSQQLSSRSICDHNCIFRGVVIKRTAKTVTVTTAMKGVKRCKVHFDSNGDEFIFPFGQYSMSPVFRA
jgi:hypothetical protein